MSNKTRIASLDLFRGLMLLSMTFNHLLVYPFLSIDPLHQMIQKIVYSSYGFLSNSEGFFFIAGISCGLSSAQPFDKKWLLRKIGPLYLSHILLLLLFTVYLTFSPSYGTEWRELHHKVWVWIDQPGIQFFLDNPWQGFLLGASFLYFPPFFDILPVYMLFLLVSPFLKRNLEGGRWIFLLAGSILLWLATQFWPSALLESSLNPWIPVKLGWFHPFAIQLLFVVGLLLGAFYSKGTLISARYLVLMAAAGLSLAYLALNEAGLCLENCHQLGLHRLSFFLLKVIIALAIAQQFTSQKIEALGQHSLLVFSYHVLMTYTLIFMIPFIDTLSMGVKALLMGVCLLSLWLPVLAYKYLDKRQVNPVQ
jgi:hypothetical protein